MTTTSLSKSIFNTAWTVAGYIPGLAIIRTAIDLLVVRKKMLNHQYHGFWENIQAVQILKNPQISVARLLLRAFPLVTFIAQQVSPSSLAKPGRHRALKRSTSIEIRKCIEKVLAEAKAREDHYCNIPENDRAPFRATHNQDARFIKDAKSLFAIRDNRKNSPDLYNQFLKKLIACNPDKQELQALSSPPEYFQVIAEGTPIQLETWEELVNFTKLLQKHGEKAECAVGQKWDIDPGQRRVKTNFENQLASYLNLTGRGEGQMMGPHNQAAAINADFFRKLKIVLNLLKTDLENHDEAAAEEPRELNRRAFELKSLMDECEDGIIQGIDALYVQKYGSLGSRFCLEFTANIRKELRAHFLSVADSQLESLNIRDKDAILDPAHLQHIEAALLIAYDKKSGDQLMGLDAAKLDKAAIASVSLESAKERWPTTLDEDEYIYLARHKIIEKVVTDIPATTIRKKAYKSTIDQMVARINNPLDPDAVSLQNLLTHELQDEDEACQNVWIGYAHLDKEELYRYSLTETSLPEPSQLQLEGLLPFISPNELAYFALHWGIVA